MSVVHQNSLVDAVDEKDNVVAQVTRGSLATKVVNFRVAHVFLINDCDELLLGQLGVVRTNDPGLWGSSVAAQLFAGESYEDAARRRMKDELGLSVPLQFVSKVAVPEGRALKFVGLFIARADRPKNLEPNHVAELRFRPWKWVINRVKKRPADFTPTFRILIDRCVSFGILPK